MSGIEPAASRSEVSLKEATWDGGANLIGNSSQLAKGVGSHQTGLGSSLPCVARPRASSQKTQPI